MAADNTNLFINTVGWIASKKLELKLRQKQTSLGESDLAICKVPRTENICLSKGGWYTGH